MRRSETEAGEDARASEGISVAINAVYLNTFTRILVAFDFLQSLRLNPELHSYKKYTNFTLCKGLTSGSGYFWQSVS